MDSVKEREVNKRICWCMSVCVSVCECVHVYVCDCICVQDCVYDCVRDGNGGKKGKQFISPQSKQNSYNVAPVKHP